MYRHHDLDIVREFLKRKDLNVNERGWRINWDGYVPPLIDACRMGWLDIVRELLKRDDLNMSVQEYQGEIPLVEALIAGHLDIVCELMKRQDVNLNAQDYRGRTPLIEACRIGYLDFFRELLKRDMTLLMEVIASGFLDIACELLKREDVAVNARDNKGRTVFYLTSVEDRWDAVLLLLKHDKVDVNAQGKHSNCTMYEIATWLERHEREEWSRP